MNFDYQNICQKILQDLPGKEGEIIKSRFGLKDGERRTLETIGKDYGITRERVRQIEKSGISKIKPWLKKYQKIFQYFEEKLNFLGNFKREDKFLGILTGTANFKNQIFFLLTLEDHFKRFHQNEEFHSFWTIDTASLDRARQVINLFSQELLERKRPLPLEEFELPIEHPWVKLDEISRKRWVESALEISRQLKIGFEGLFGFSKWPEISPRRIRDKVFLVLKKEKRPLHFREAADLLGKFFKKNALCQTVHNELIRDPRFVLIGRGIYALKEWGYEEGRVKDIISKVLNGAQKPLTKEEILAQVLGQRKVKKSTILFNLGNKKYFSKNSEGKYTVVKYAS